jgi:hypothetical protein
MAVELRVADCIGGDCVRLGVPQATEGQHIGYQIDAAMITAGPDFVNVAGSAAVDQRLVSIKTA